jgi:hypothetical protein
MNFKPRNLRELAEIVIGDNKLFEYRSSSYITRFFEECDLDFAHDGSTRWSWTASRLAELLQDPQPAQVPHPQTSDQARCSRRRLFHQALVIHVQRVFRKPL